MARNMMLPYTLLRLPTTGKNPLSKYGKQINKN